MSGLPYPTRPSFYNGKRQEPLSSPARTFQTIDPSTGRPLADVVTATEADCDAAIAAASKAFESWSQTTTVERSRILHKAVAILRARNEELAKVETHDTGKPYSETSTVDIVTGADVLEYYANLIGAGGLEGERIRLRNGVWVNSMREPLGVCAGIGAWNYPIQIALWKSAPCLAAGNTMVYKPSEFTPLHGLLLAEIYAEAGLPPGVFNVVNGDGRVGAYLTTHPNIAKVSFTGQVSTGQKVAGAAAGGMKYVTMELGGKSPLLVLPDCEPSLAADGAMMANFFSSGQVCTNGTRVFVPRQMRDAFHAALAERMPHVRAGDLMHPDTNLGPLSSKVHHEKVTAFIQRAAQQHKGKLLHGGLGAPEGVPAECKSGYWIRPTVFTDVTDDMEIAQQEIFGPVMCVLFYDTVDEAIVRANNTQLGLAAGVFTRDLEQAQYVIDRLQAGITWINTWGESPAEMSVGGWKCSGLGVENGREGIKEWTRNKSTLVDGSGEFASVFAPRQAAAEKEGTGKSKL